MNFRRRTENMRQNTCIEINHSQIFPYKTIMNVHERTNTFKESFNFTDKKPQVRLPFRFNKVRITRKQWFSYNSKTIQLMKNNVVPIPRSPIERKLARKSIKENITMIIPKHHYKYFKRKQIINNPYMPQVKISKEENNPKKPLFIVSTKNKYIANERSSVRNNERLLSARIKNRYKNNQEDELSKTFGVFPKSMNTTGYLRK